MYEMTEGIIIRCISGPCIASSFDHCRVSYKMGLLRLVFVPLSTRSGLASIGRQQITNSSCICCIASEVY